MRRVLFMMLVMVAGGCSSPEREGVSSRAPSPTATRPATLSPADMRAYVAVRKRALQTVEDALQAATPQAVGPAAALPDLAEAERAAASALGVDVQRYAWVRDRIARVLAWQRETEDRHRLQAELRRTQGDLLAQLAHATDPASREFLHAQVRSIDAQLAKLAKELSGAPAVQAEAALIEAVRVDLALLHSQEERVQERLRQLVRRPSVDGGGKTKGTLSSP